MTPRSWNVRAYQGREVRIQIIDAESGNFGWLNVDEIVEIEDNVSSVPLFHNSLMAIATPNPFNPMTEIQFQLSEQSVTSVSIHDLRGRKVWSSEPRLLPAGNAVIKWHGTDLEGQAVASGSYIYRISVGSRAVHTGKITLAK